MEGYKIIGHIDVGEDFVSRVHKTVCAKCGRRIDEQLAFPTLFINDAEEKVYTLLCDDCLESQ
jgi:hypothetical protein